MFFQPDTEVLIPHLETFDTISSSKAWVEAILDSGPTRLASTALFKFGLLDAEALGSARLKNIVLGGFEALSQLLEPKHEEHPDPGSLVAVFRLLCYTAAEDFDLAGPDSKVHESVMHSYAMASLSFAERELKHERDEITNILSAYNNYNIEELRKFEL